MRKTVVECDDLQVVEVERFIRNLSLGWTLVDICSLHRSWGGDEEARNCASHHAIGAGPGVTDILAVLQNALCKLLLPNAVQGTLVQQRADLWGAKAALWWALGEMEYEGPEDLGVGCCSGLAAGPTVESSQPRRIVPMFP